MARPCTGHQTGGRRHGITSPNRVWVQGQVTELDSQWKLCGGGAWGGGLIFSGTRESLMAVAQVPEQPPGITVKGTCRFPGLENSECG